MPVVVCTECGGKIATSLTQCPHCGAAAANQPQNASASGDDTSRLLQLADAALEAGNNAEAFQYYTRLIEANPANPRAWAGKGLSAGRQSSLAKSRIAEASAAFETALAQDSIDDATLHLIGHEGAMLAQDFHQVAASHHVEFHTFEDGSRKRNLELADDYIRHARSTLRLLLVTNRATALRLSRTDEPARRELLTKLLEQDLEAIELIANRREMLSAAGGLFSMKMIAPERALESLTEDLNFVTDAIVASLPAESAIKQEQQAAAAEREAQAAQQAQHEAAKRERAAKDEAAWNGAIAAWRANPHRHRFGKAGLIAMIALMVLSQFDLPDDVYGVAGVAMLGLLAVWAIQFFWTVLRHYVRQQQTE